jgi:hypothetical protein
MEYIFENSFGKTIYNASSNMLEIHWKDSTEELEDEDFKAFLLQFTQDLLKFQTSGFFVNATKKMFIMRNEMQEWHDEVIVPKYIDAGIRKIAFHVGNNSTVDISLELTFDEKNSQKLQTRFFDDAENAKEWLVKSVKVA